MKDGLSIPALLSFLGYEAARGILANFSASDREKLAFEAARGGFSEEAGENAVECMGKHIAAYRLVGQVGVSAARRELGKQFGASSVDGILDRVSTVASLEQAEVCESDYGLPWGELDSFGLAHMIGYLPAEHAGQVLMEHCQSVASVALVCDAAGILEHLGEVLSTLDPVDREEMIDEIAFCEPELATRLQIHLCGLFDILDLDYKELARVLGGSAVEDIALALLEAEKVNGVALEDEQASGSSLAERPSRSSRSSPPVDSPKDFFLAPSYV